MNSQTSDDAIDSSHFHNVFECAAVPTLVVGGEGHRVVNANRSARRLLADFAGRLNNADFCSMGVVDDARGIATVLRACIDDESQFGYLRFRFNPPSGPSVNTEVVITGCGELEGVGPAAVVQIRNISHGNSLGVFISHVADIPDGDTLLNAMRWGPLATMPVHSMALTYVHREEEQIRLLGAFNWGRTCAVSTTSAR
ncbi:MAG: hypothetical protein ACKOFF_09380 [Acidimicrobiales bacterium]